MIFSFEWMIGQHTGAGQYGLGLARALVRAGHEFLLANGIADECDPLTKDGVNGWAPYGSTGVDHIAHLIPVGNNFAPCELPPHEGSLRVGLVTTEATGLTEQNVSDLQTYDLLLSASEWNRQILASHGVESIAWTQGIDTHTFRPGPRQRPAGAPLLIFSGGKIEFRKGHDLVIDTFRRLRKAHPELPVKLVIAWHNFWPATIGQLHHTGLLTSLPQPSKETGRYDFRGWLQTQGVHPSDVIDLGVLSPLEMAAAMRECDAGLFLSRAEANGNMPLEECMASGVPCVVSANTGHLEYTDEPLLTFVERTDPMRLKPKDYSGTEGWSEAHPEYAASALYTRLTDPLRNVPSYYPALAKGFARRWSWDARAALLIRYVADAWRGVRPSPEHRQSPATPVPDDSDSAQEVPPVALRESPSDTHAAPSPSPDT